MNDSYNNKVESFINKLDNELILRKKYLGYLNEILHELKSNNHKFTFIRTTVPELYAHYEGFLKFSFLELISFLKTLDLSNDDININYLIFCLLTKLENHIVTQDAKARRILDVFYNVFNANESFLKNADIDKYILNHDTLKYTLEILSIDRTNATFQMDKLGVLYQRRNGIAHGELKTGNAFSISKNRDITDAQVQTSYNIWTEDYRCVVETLDIIKNTLIDYIIDKEYLNT
ncbi:MAE_28990/MAE_18760 family HEPN-like nuclease [Sporosalibacterium faouarense]|uniref:MAE_28990/MAE_18760 family HEPN-like nuclease n=1 Tax=Sporosalibacterium faouarense TaxID=516123 RepID=UPI00192ABC1A|nr:MAE_28990/MAE_18760 family HEPN-like nuclease [Sporosalibacterium faouarense]